jgi:hypothetical protein
MRKDVISDLVGYLIKDPASYASDRQARRYPMIAIEVFEAGISEIIREFVTPRLPNEQIGNSKVPSPQVSARDQNYFFPLLDEFFSFLTQITELNPTLAAFFGRLLDVLYSQHPVEVNRRHELDQACNSSSISFC